MLSRSHRWLLPLLLTVLASVSFAQTPVTMTGTDDLDAPRSVLNVGTLRGEQFSASESLLPMFDARALAWIAAVLTLALIARVRPVTTMRNVDAIMFALSSVLLLLRDDPGVIESNSGPIEVRWFAYLVATIFAAYWLLRGIMLLFNKTPRPIEANMAEGGMSVLAIAGLVMAITTIGNAPLTEGARDGFLGGLATHEAGRMPYGDVAADYRSPLLYLAFAGANAVAPSSIEVDGSTVDLKWDNQPDWAGAPWEQQADLLTVRLVNSVCFLLLFAAVTLVGQRLHSIAFGLSLGVVLCFYPGFVECLPRPEITLPAALLGWTIYFATIPGIGGLLAMLTITLAGLSWGWAFLAIPVLLGYFFGKRWNGFGAAFGAIAGLCGIVAGLLYFVPPSLPRPSGAMALAGWQPTHVASLSDDGVIAIRESAAAEPEQEQVQSRLWRYLMQESITLETPDLPLALPAGTPASSVQFQRLMPDPESHGQLQAAYRTAMANEPALSQLRAATRTVLEATWKPDPGDVPPPVRPGTWQVWEADSEMDASTWTQIRRISKGAVGLLAVLIGVILFRTSGAGVHQLLGGLLAIAAATLMVSGTGAVSNLIVLAPMILACLSAGGAPGPTGDDGQPRISVNN